jgi:ADP-ribose pyrophosphatase YjhB (NUDIX family)
METNSILKKITKKGDIAVSFIFREGKLLIGLRNYKADEWKDISVWTVPGGHCEKGETFEETLKRETLEEIGVDDLIVTEYLGVVAGAKEGDTVYVFKAETNQEPKLMEPENFSEWKWSSISDIPSNFINPEALRLIKHEFKVMGSNGSRP